MRLSLTLADGRRARGERPTLTTIVGFSKSSMVLESRFLLRSAALEPFVSWFSDVAELGVRIRDSGRVASREGALLAGSICRHTSEAASMR